MTGGIPLPCLEGRRVAKIISGAVYGNVGNGATLYGEEKFHAARGHGFAAEPSNPSPTTRQTARLSRPPRSASRRFYPLPQRSGAAMKSAAKMLRGNVITGAVSIAVLSAGDTVNIFRGRISGKQLLKNVANTTSSVAGGTAGWVGGAAAGAALGSIVPGIGNAVGGVVGGIAGALGGGAAAGKLSDTVLGAFIEDDADAMARVIEGVFLAMATDCLLTQREVEHVVDHLGESITAKNLREMFASSDRSAYARRIVWPPVERELDRRQRIALPDPEGLRRGLRLLLEEMADRGEKLAFE